MADSRETVEAFVTGWPVKHSRSPLIHHHWLDTFGIRGDYRREAVTVEDFPAFIAGLKSGTSPYVGGNVTIPHKEAACYLADRRDTVVEELGAANTLWMEDGELCGARSRGCQPRRNLGPSRTRRFRDQRRQPDTSARP